MHQAVHHFAAHDRSASDAGANGDVNEIGNSPPRAPTRFPQRRSIHVSVKADRHPEFSMEKARQIVVLPLDLGSRRDVSEASRLAIEVYRTKGSDTDCIQSFASLTTKEFGDALQCH